MNKEILKSNEFVVEVWESKFSDDGSVLKSDIAEGWGDIDWLVKAVSPIGFDAKEIIIDFSETEDLDVLRFFSDWMESGVSRDVVISLGSKYGVRFRSCVVRDIIISTLDVMDNTSVEVSVVLSCDEVGVVFKTEPEND